jgi:hypothetical protein
MSGKMGYKDKSYYDGYILKPPKNGDRCVLSGYNGSHVSSIHDFSTITLLFFHHTPNIGVPENNGVTLPKPRTKYTQELM